jgi:hypothetical protein
MNMEGANRTPQSNQNKAPFTDRERRERIIAERGNANWAIVKKVQNIANFISAEGVLWREDFADFFPSIGRSIRSLSENIRRNHESYYLSAKAKNLSHPYAVVTERVKGLFVTSADMTHRFEHFVDKCLRGLETKTEKFRNVVQVFMDALDNIASAIRETEERSKVEAARAEKEYLATRIKALESAINGVVAVGQNVNDKLNECYLARDQGTAYVDAISNARGKGPFEAMLKALPEQGSPGVNDNEEGVIPAAA